MLVAPKALPRSTGPGIQRVRHARWQDSKLRAVEQQTSPSTVVVGDGLPSTSQPSRVEGTTVAFSGFKQGEQRVREQQKALGARGRVNGHLVAWRCISRLQRHPALPPCVFPTQRSTWPCPPASTQSWMHARSSGWTMTRSSAWVAGPLRPVCTSQPPSPHPPSARPAQPACPMPPPLCGGPGATWVNCASSTSG